MPTAVVALCSIASAICFVLGLIRMSRVRTARGGNRLAAVGMLLGVTATLLDVGVGDAGLLAAGIGGGAVLGLLNAMTRTPSPAMVAALGALGAGASGLAAVGIANAEMSEVGGLDGVVARFGAVHVAALGLGAVLAAGTVLASLVARGGAKSARGGIALSRVNSGAGLAAAMLGVALHDYVLTIVGGLIGTAGIALGRIIAGTLAAAEGAGSDYKNLRTCGAEEAAMVLETAHSVVMVPGYGLAVAQAQHAAHELGKLLERRGTRVVYAIHEVAGIIPGHMNILLDEAGVPTEKLCDVDGANAALATADVALVLGANDIVNPAAEGEPGSPVFGMPFIDVRQARAVFVVKRSLRPGFAGVRNELFEHPGTTMVLGDVK